ncbi:MAG: hypothetical protein F4Z01_00120, partial [Gammaproteobacteria bacterium]|nr:hypothetical protein [Gammaproteobacteria bacterium]
MTHIRLFASLSMVLLASACAVVDLEYRFDDESTRLGDASLWDDWYDTIKRTNDEIISIEGCNEDESECDRTMLQISVLVNNGKDLELTQQLQLVNRYVN